jgi:hypothetical protein
MKDLALRSLPQLAITANAATPAPAQAGAWAWSTVLNCPMQWDGSAWRRLPVGDGPATRSLGLAMGDGSAVLSTGMKGRVRCPWTGTIVGWSLMGSPSGSATFDIWKANASIPSVANTITASAKPSVSSADYAESSTLTGWTTSVSAGDVLAFNADALTLFTELTIQLSILVTG